MSNKHIKIGMGQLLVEGGEPERNLERAEEMIMDASSMGCDIVLLPETLDLAWTHPSAKTEAMPIPGPYSERLCASARENGVYVCAGLTERAENCVYNTAILINSSGEIALKYHKINLLVVEHDFYTVGNHLSVVDTPFGILGVNICADNYLDSLDLGHALCRMMPQVILSPSSWTVDYSITEEDDPYGEKWFKPYFTLANTYNIIIVSATSVGYIVGGPYEGKKMIGSSLAVGRHGIIAQGQCNEFAGQLVVAEFDVPQRNEKGTEIGEMRRKKGSLK